MDDNVNFIDRMISLLDEVRFSKRINVAFDFSKAREQLGCTSPHIVFLDINMPGKNGLELLRYIVEHQPAAVVVMLTNHTEDYYREQCKELGARYFLDKSNDFLQVPEIVNEFYRNSMEKSQSQ